MRRALGPRLLAVAVLLLAAALTHHVSEGQSGRLLKIGALTDAWGPTMGMVGFRDGLRDLGYRENQDYVLGVRFTQGSAAELPEAARDLVKHGVDLIIVAGGAAAATAAQSATAKIPILFMGGRDPVDTGLVKSFSRPGGNITGIADLEVELISKRMEILREIVPGLKRLLVVYDATNPDSVSKLEAHREAARPLGLALLEKPVRTEDEARAVISAARKGEVDGIIAPRALSLNIPGLVLELASKRSLPAIFQDAYFVERDGLVSYAASTYQVGRQAARLADRIFKGARPADLPVEQPTKFDLVINVKTATALGLAIPQSVLLRADHVIQ
jgi:putative ABC transport system substrate-binding protein